MGVWLDARHRLMKLLARLRLWGIFAVGSLSSTRQEGKGMNTIQKN